MESIDRKEQLAGLASRIRAMSEGQKRELVERFGSIFTPEGHALSLFNTVGLIQQAGGRSLGQVGGFRQWLKAGRMVRKGEHACGVIWVPLHGKKSAKTPSEEGENAVAPQKPRFKIIPVFSVDQTEPARDMALA